MLSQARNMASEQKLEDLNVTSDELERIAKALKDENFRKMFVEYAEEISDPENRRLYEQEIAQMESDRGMDVQFINPQPGHVLKTSVDGTTKAFINICQSDKIGTPSSKRETNESGQSGMMWHIPHSFAPPREDRDEKEECKVFDVVFHPDTYRMSERNERFLKLVHDTAIDGIERQFGVKIDKKNMKKWKDNFKGTPQATVIRSKRQDGSKDSGDNSSGMSDILKNMPYPYDNKPTDEKTKEKELEIKKREEMKKNKDAKTKKRNAKRGEEDATVPEYTIIHRSDLDLQEFTNAPDSRPSTRPKDLIVKIFLPLLTSAGPVNLDIFEQQLKLESKEPAAYSLDIKLPYQVNDDEGSAKFDKANRCLVVTLPVVPGVIPKLPSFIEDEKRNGDENNQNVSTDPDDFNNVHPKIEVLASIENQTEEPQKLFKTDPVNEDIVSDDIASNASVPSIMYSYPDFSYNQDKETLTFIFNVKNIAEDTITKYFPDSNSMKITFVSLGTGGFPMYYCLYLKFGVSCRIAHDHCTTDLSELNLVLVLLKHKYSRSLWDKFQAGVGEDEMEVKLLAESADAMARLNRQ